MIAEWLPDHVAKLRASIHSKLLWAFLAIVAIMLASGYVGLQALNEMHRRTEDMEELQRKIAAYRQLNHDTVAQLYSVASSLLKPEERRLQATLRQLNQFGYDLDRLQFVAQDEKEILANLSKDYEKFIEIVTQVIALIRSGQGDEGRELQLAAATPHSERLERLTNELVNKAEADMIVSIEAANAAYANSKKAVAALAVASVALALLLGYAISSSIVGPVRAMEARMREIAEGDFDRKLKVPNRDELGALADGLNRMSEQLGKAHSELEAVSRHKSEFLANMSHELRTPLNAVIGFSEVLQQKMFGDLNEKQMEYVADIHASGRHLLSLINDILDLSKIEAGKLELDRSRFDLPNTIENTLTLIRERATRHGLTLNLSLDESLDEIEADERKVRQIMLNLLSNAVKFTADGGQIEVTGSVIDDAAQIAVRDSGIGIALEDQATIFEEFRQVGGDHEGKREGTGLGLTLARKFVELHGGRIWVDSAVGNGTTFTFTLPLTTRPNHSISPASETQTQPRDSQQWAAN